MIGMGAAMTMAKKSRATQLFRKLDVNHDNRISSGAVYNGLSQLDHSLTEDQLSYAASLHKSMDLKGFLEIYTRLELGNNDGLHSSVIRHEVQTLLYRLSLFTTRW